MLPGTYQLNYTVKGKSTGEFLQYDADPPCSDEPVFTTIKQENGRWKLENKDGWFLGFGVDLDEKKTKWSNIWVGLYEPKPPNYRGRFSHAIHAVTWDIVNVGYYQFKLRAYYHDKPVGWLSNDLYDTAILEDCHSDYAKVFEIRPAIVTLHAVVIDIDFGERKTINDLLQLSPNIVKEQDPSNKITLVLETDGVELGGQKKFEKAATSRFSYRFNGRIGNPLTMSLSQTVVAKAKNPFGAQEVSSMPAVTSSVDLGAYQQWTIPKTTTFSNTLSYNLTKSGTYECGMAIWKMKSLEIPFTATIELRAKDRDNKFSGEQVLSFFNNNRMKGEVMMPINQNSIKIKMAGTMKADMAYKSEPWIRRLTERR